MEKEIYKLRQEGLEAFLNDDQVKELYKKLLKVYNNAIPTIVQNASEKVISVSMIYDDKTTKLISELHQRIQSRKDEIMSHYDKRIRSLTHG